MSFFGTRYTHMLHVYLVPDRLRPVPGTKKEKAYPVPIGVNVVPGMQK
ncbi:hypothetical protein GLV98_13455 [Halobacillus litoralis]|uniref:Uncharacterized protein n=1 Tax=Halobacillus litoralis TaxID=45668 RepID=A0A845EH26_9BACI|nr:hypothetical protein [Halobacillus litoralis]MYL50498.1 hypothetical protein [Halobacillus litoralis]